MEQTEFKARLQAASDLYSQGRFVVALAFLDALDQSLPNT